MNSLEAQDTDSSTNGTQDPYKMVDPNSPNAVTLEAVASGAESEGSTDAPATPTQVQ
jgi:hypothetical protein